MVMQLLPLLLVVSTSSWMICSASGNNEVCERTNFLPFKESDLYLVRFNNQPCDTIDYNQSHPFCENSGWGDEEASVVCRSEMNTKYGIGRYLGVKATSQEVRFSHVSCTGNERGLEECTVGNFTSHNCSQAGIVQCFNVSQVLVSRTNIYAPFQHVEVSENETVEFCIIVWGPLTEALHVMVETTDNFALAGCDYHPLRQTLTFESSDMTRSHQCLQIEIIDDSLAEDWEMFSVLLSTNSSAVNLTRHEFDVFIEPNDDNEPCISGSVTVVSDEYNNSPQLVEFCSEGVWSPVCDYNWTLQDATVVCRELGYTYLDANTFNQGNNVMTNATIIECEDSDYTLGDCSIIQTQNYTTCHYALVQCDSDEDSGSEDEGGGVGIRLILGVVIMGVLVVLVMIVVVVIIVIVLKHKTKDITKLSDTEELEYNHRYERSNKFQGRDNGNGEKHLDNPVYKSTEGCEPLPKTNGTLERNFQNPLYEFEKKVNGNQPHTYAVLESEGPEYAVPEAVPKPDSGAANASPATVKHSYDYVEPTTDSTTNVATANHAYDYVEPTVGSVGASATPLPAVSVKHSYDYVENNSDDKVV